MPESNEPIIDNIILDHSTSIEKKDNNEEIVLFSSLKADAKPIKPYKLNTSGIEYTQLYSSKCAICNSPLRTLLEHAYIDSGKKVNAVLKFFEEHYNAKLNWPQVDLHLKRHCDMSIIRTPGLLFYEGRENEIAKYKFREYDLALTVVIAEIDEVRGQNARTPDEVYKRTNILEKLTKQLMQIKQLRDDNAIGLPNVFAVLFELHDMMVNDEDKRIIRQKTRELKESMS
jgi:hypothetical protein